MFVVQQSGFWQGEYGYTEKWFVVDDADGRVIIRTDVEEEAQRAAHCMNQAVRRE